MTPKHAGPAPPIGPPTGRSPDPERPDAPVRADSAPANNRSLVVVSNRLPFTAERRPEGTRFRRSAGGLVAALEPVLAQRGGVWVGWTGAAREDGAGDAAGGALPAATDHVSYRAVPLTAHEIALYYAGFANRTIWPLFHYFVGHTQIDGATWRAYERVNERFAHVAAEASDDEALV
ncbi:MAG: trehalose-6-phosphate synthase, partial [Gemmatimonadetes bacterium]